MNKLILALILLILSCFGALAAPEADHKCNDYAASSNGKMQICVNRLTSSEVTFKLRYSDNREMPQGKYVIRVGSPYSYSPIKVEKVLSGRSRLLYIKMPIYWSGNEIKYFYGTNEASSHYSGRVTMSNPSDISPPTVSGAPSSITIDDNGHFQMYGQVRTDNADQLNIVTLVISTANNHDQSTYRYFVNGNTFDLSKVTLRADRAPLNNTRSHTLGIWVKTLAYSEPQNPLVTANITIRQPQTQAPYVDGFGSQNINIAAEQSSHRLPGKVWAKGGLKRVVIELTNNATGVTGYLDSGTLTGVERFTLKALTIRRTQFASGNYSGRILAYTSIYSSGFNVQSFNLTFENRQPYFDGHLPDLSLTQGQEIDLKGIVSSDISDKLTKVTFVVTDNQLNTVYSATSDNINQQSFDLTKLKIQSEQLPIGRFTAGLWAKSQSFGDPNTPLATFVIEIAQPATNDPSYLVEKRIVRHAEDYRLQDKTTAAEIATMLFRILGDGWDKAPAYFNQLYAINSPSFSNVTDGRVWYFLPVNSLAQLRLGQNSSVLLPLLTQPSNEYALFTPGGTVNTKQLAQSLLLSYKKPFTNADNAVSQLTDKGIVLSNANTSSELTRSEVFGILTRTLQHSEFNLPIITTSDFVLPLHAQKAGSRFEFNTPAGLSSPIVDVATNKLLENDEYLIYQMQATSNEKGYCYWQLAGSGFIRHVANNTANTGKSCRLIVKVARKNKISHQVNFNLDYYTESGSHTAKSGKLSGPQKNGYKHNYAPVLTYSHDVTERQLGGWLIEFSGRATASAYDAETRHGITDMTWTVSLDGEEIDKQTSFVDSQGKFKWQYRAMKLGKYQIEIAVSDVFGALLTAKKTFNVNLEGQQFGTVQLLDLQKKPITNTRFRLSQLNDEQVLVKRYEYARTDDFGRFSYNYAEVARYVDVQALGQHFIYRGRPGYFQVTLGQKGDDGEQNEPSPTEPTPASEFDNLVMLDDTLKNCVVTYAKQKGWTELTQMTELNCDGMNIHLLDGIDQLTELMNLSLADNFITAIEPLLRMSKLQDLNLNNNDIVHLDILVRLKNLDKLSLAGNPVRNLAALFYKGGMEHIDISGIATLTCEDLSRLSSVMQPGNKVIKPTTCLTEVSVENVALADSNLQKCVDKYVEIGNWKGTQHVTVLSCGDKNISNLKGLEQFTSLKYLWLADNQISDLTPLSKLDSLLMLSVRDNRLTKIDALENLHRLDDLYLSNNSIETITPIVNLSNLTNLYLTSNKIRSISPLVNLIFMKKLSLYGNQVDDVSSLTGLIKLESLHLDRNNIADIAPLGELTRLEVLGLAYNQVSNISGLSPLINLRQLFVNGNQVADITALSHLSNLLGLNLAYNKISDVTPLASLSQLQALRLERNQLNDLSGLEQLSELEYLILYLNPLKDISTLTSLHKLKTLNLALTEVNDIEPLTVLGDLRSLSLYRSKVRDILPLSKMSNLEYLNLGEIQLSDLTPLSNLKKLSWLRLYNNGISNIDTLFSLPELYWVDLRFNEQVKCSDLDRLQVQIADKERAELQRPQTCSP